MKYFKIILFLFLTLNFSLSFSASDCLEIASKIINSNAKIKASDYKRPFKRDLDGYVRFLGLSYSNKHDSLKKGSVVFDVGAGLGVASLEDSTHDLKVFAINAQNFWEDLKMAPLSDSYDTPAVTIEDLAYMFKVPLDDIKLGKEKVWSHELGKEITRPTMQKLKRKQREIVRERVFEFIEKQKSAKAYHYLVGFAEDQLPPITYKADLIRDLYGAYFYSADKLLLLDLYYSKLKKSGQVFIRLSTSTGDSAQSFIEINAKKSMSFEKYLIENYPNVFSIESASQGQVLVMKKDPELESLGLSSIFELMPEKVKMRRMNETEVPEAWFKKKKAKK
jgi:hypothetical protein